MKVLFIVNSLQFGGAEKHVVSLLNGLDTERFALSLAYLKDFTPLLAQLAVERLAGGAFCVGVARWMDLAAVRRLARYIDEHEIDLVVSTNGYSLAYGALARVFARRRSQLIEVFHTTETIGWTARVQMLLYRPFFAISDRLVYVCQSQMQHWRRRLLFARSTSVIHNGIDVEYFRDRYSSDDKRAVRERFGFAEDDLVIGLCAVMRPEKAHGDLLRAVAELRRRGVPAKALLIGDGVERANIEAQIAALGLQQVVQISGFANDVRPLIAACDVMALVSHQVETFSIAALEAMALGKPMVMSRIGGAAEQIWPGENGYLYERGDIAALVQAIAGLGDRTTCQQMGARARALVVEHFSLPAMTAKFTEVFESQCARAGGGARAGTR